MSNHNILEADFDRPTGISSVGASPSFAPTQSSVQMTLMINSLQTLILHWLQLN